MDESWKQYTAFTVGNLGFFKCDHMPFGLCSSPATFQRLMQNCLGELNLVYCLIYLDDIVVFLHTAAEHLHCLHIVFDQFREHNLKLKLSKCNFFQRGNHLLGALNLKGWSVTQQLKLEGHCGVHAASKLHGVMCFPWSGWLLQGIHSGVHMYCTAT